MMLTHANSEVAAVRVSRPARDGELTDRSVVEFGVTSFAFRVVCFSKSFLRKLHIDNRN